MMNRYSHKFTKSLTKDEREKLMKIIHGALPRISGSITFNEESTEVILNTVAPLMNSEKQRLQRTVARWADPKAYWRLKWQQAKAITDATLRAKAMQQIRDVVLDLEDEATLTTVFESVMVKKTTKIGRIRKWFSSGI